MPQALVELPGLISLAAGFDSQAAHHSAHPFTTRGCPILGSSVTTTSWSIFAVTYPGIGALLCCHTAHSRSAGGV